MDWNEHERQVASEQERCQNAALSGRSVEYHSVAG
jgi:hypothetical protein